MVEEVQARAALRSRGGTPRPCRCVACPKRGAAAGASSAAAARAQAAMKDFQDKNTYTAPTTAGGATAA